MLNKFFLILLLPVGLLSSCFEEDEPLPPYEGVVTTIKNHIEYYQSFYDFETNTVVASFFTSAWTIGFSCHKNEFSIITNSGDNWFAFNTNQSNIFANVIYPEKKIWEYDNQTYFPDSTAIDKWLAINNADTVYTGTVYLIGKYIGTGYSQIFRIKFLKVDSNSYTFCFKPNENSTVADTIIMQKIPTKNFVYYSLTDSQMLDIEPEKSRYDINFGPYYDIATQLGITAPYLVRGVLLNINNLEACADSTHSFESIISEDLSNYSFSSQRNTIGFSWKEVIINPASNSASYRIRPEMNYLIKTVEGNSFKMRFWSYELDGENGYPSFEVEKLNFSL